jgi:hypothetical protein
LFVYVFYRTDKTLVTRLFIALFSREEYSFLKTRIRSFLPLADCLIYSVPEGLWVFCITVTSSFFYLEGRKKKWDLVYVPILAAVLMEIFQLLHLANGRFDVMDINVSIGFWLLAIFCTRTNADKEPLFHTLNKKTICCMGSYLIVYLAHVTY